MKAKCVASLLYLFTTASHIWYNRGMKKALFLKCRLPTSHLYPRCLMPIERHQFAPNASSEQFLIQEKLSLKVSWCSTAPLHPLRPTNVYWYKPCPVLPIFCLLHICEELLFNSFIRNSTKPLSWCLKKLEKYATERFQNVIICTTAMCAIGPRNGYQTIRIKIRDLVNTFPARIGCKVTGNKLTVDYS